MKEKILLIAPPFTTSNSPYISLPVLMAWLRQNDVPCRFLDLGLELTRNLLADHHHLQQSFAYVCDTFIELNEKPRLTPWQANHIAQLQMLLHRLGVAGQLQNQREKLVGLLAETAPNLQLELISAPYWPNCLLASRELQLLCRFNPYSSEDLVAAATGNFFFTGTLQNLLAEQLRQQSYSLVGLSVVFDQQIIPAMQCAAIIKALAPELHITMGGPFATIHLRHIENPDFFEFIDSIVLDEGELPLLELYHELRRPHPNFSKVSGLIRRNRQHKVVVTPGKPFLPLDKLPTPAFAECTLDNYPDPANMQLPFRLSKGCYWQKCSFCRTNLSLCRNYHQPPVHLMYEQLREVIEQTGVRDYLFSDESSSPKILEQLSERILRDNLRIRWTFHTRVDSRALGRKRIQLFREAGCTGFTLGIESLSDRLLKLLNKGITVAETEQTLTQIKGIVPVNGYMMLGLPTETVEELENSQRKVEQYRQDGLLASYTYSLFYLSPGSPMHREPERYGITIDHEWLQGADLQPNNFHNYQTSGMSRLQACRYYYQFQGRKLPARLHEIPFRIDGELHFPHYDLRRIAKSLGHYFTRQLDTPFVKWLEIVQENCPAIEARKQWWEML